jgi:hypothetical protein
MILVAARLDEQATAPSRLASGGFVLVLPAALGEPLSLQASFEVSGCTGYVLGARGTRGTRGHRRAA